MDLNTYVRIIYLFFIFLTSSVRGRLFVLINSKNLKYNIITLMTPKVGTAKNPTWFLVVWGSLSYSPSYPSINLDSVYFLDWSENSEKCESYNWECGVGMRVGVCCLLTLEWKHKIEIKIQFMCLLYLGLWVNIFKL